jgi:hypothetical protein
MAEHREHGYEVTRPGVEAKVRTLAGVVAISRGGGALRQKGLAATGMFFPTLMVEAFVADLQPLVMCTADG